MNADQELENIFQNKCLSRLPTVCDVESKCKLAAVRQNVCYIVAAVVFNEHGELLLIQEAKHTCYGRWYLPAGRVEVGESLIAAVKREVLEEAGFIFEPTGLICIEENGGQWIRFTFTGNIVSGSLKTFENEDSESIQAGWFSTTESVSLRCEDILSLIERTKVRISAFKTNSTSRLLPLVHSQSLLYVRAVTVMITEKGLHVLAVKQRRKNCEATTVVIRLPIACFKPSDESIYEPVTRIFEKLFPAGDETGFPWSMELLGVLSMEHSGLHGDGVSFNLAVHLKTESGELPPVDEAVAEWLLFKPESNDFKHLQLEYMMSHTVPIISLGRVR